MFMSPATPRQDFADTLVALPPPPRKARVPERRASAVDPLEQMALVDGADRSLLLLVACVAAATLSLALLSAFV